LKEQSVLACQHLFTMGFIFDTRSSSRQYQHYQSENGIGRWQGHMLLTDPLIF